MDFADDGAALPSADATFDAPDFALPETDAQPEAAPVTDDLDFGFPDAGDAIGANESDAGLSGLDDGFDLPPATSEAPAADADDLGSGSDFDLASPLQHRLMTLGCPQLIILISMQHLWQQLTPLPQRLTILAATLVCLPPMRIYHLLILLTYQQTPAQI
jgi:hypothetical protein